MSVGSDSPGAVKPVPIAKLGVLPYFAKPTWFELVLIIPGVRVLSASNSDFYKLRSSLSLSIRSLKSLISPFYLKI